MTPSARNTTTTTNTNGSKVLSSPTGTQMTSTNISSSNSSGFQNGVVARRGGRDSNASSNNSSLNSSFDSLGDLPNPRVGSNPRGHDYNARNERVRESYMEAVSTVSLDNDRGSITL